MTECPSCRTVHKEQPQFCQNCGYQFGSAPEAHLAPPRLGRVTPGKVLFALVFLAFVAYMKFGREDVGPPPSSVTGDARPAPSAPTVPMEPPLELVQYTWHVEYGYAILEGQVRNISPQPLKNVTAVASFYDADGGFITSSDALIDYNPVLPGQRSPFKVMATKNPAMHKAGVEFKELLGGTIPFRSAESKTGKKD